MIQDLFLLQRAPEGKVVAIMQPYFFPYNGYFRLFHCADEFVILDSVQFPRRGRVHRTEVPGAQGRLQWLTLPLAYAPRDALIASIAFHADARRRLDEILQAIPWFKTADGVGAAAVRAFLNAPLGNFVTFLEDGLKLVVDLLGLEVKISRSSALDIDPDIMGEDRIIAIAQMLQATSYLNSPGGRDLYHAGKFADAGLKLTFLEPYRGPYFSMLKSIMTENLTDIVRDVQATSLTVDAVP